MHVITLAAWLDHWSCDILHRGREACFLTPLNHLTGDPSEEIMCKVVVLNECPGMHLACLGIENYKYMRYYPGFAEYQDRCDFYEMEALENV